MDVLPFLAAGWVLLIALYGMVTSRNLIHTIGCLVVAQSSTYLMLLGIGYRRGGTAPVYGDLVPGSRPVVDPVVQALTLTDIVVAATVTALLLALTIQLRKRHGTVDPQVLTALRG
ncbi:sodium:proton antiporter [Streptomyces sp. ISL-86]|uniref:sodium:proton antiporter n=1 Tax=Streptomyces sp. ISL-86 TaxID=2819187 RepID=UPI001BEB56B0|nr:cation:proton antiporter subunit C [Streptomyces sp. ISL-86]MBT2455780.1 cation:proton antiporter subunit C [Streptomyces sp. ISL-86]